MDVADNRWNSNSALWPWKRSREQIYSFYGPLSLLLLFGLWAMLLVAAYGLIFFGMHTPFNDPTHPVNALSRFRSSLYISGTTIFTLGLGDILPATQTARALVVIEAGTGRALGLADPGDHHVGDDAEAQPVLGSSRLGGIGLRVMDECNLSRWNAGTDELRDAEGR